MSVVFYVSGHGFGHASRQVEIVNALSARRPDLRIVLRTAVDPALLARTVRHPYVLSPGECDPGIVQTTSLAHDDAATLRLARAFYETFDRRVDDEAELLTREEATLVVSDIPPLAIAAATRLGLPSVAIANFTWDWIYETHPGFDGIPDVLASIRAAYAQTTLALELPFGGGFDVFPRTERLPLVCRRPTWAPSDTRAALGLPLNRPIALLSFGGYGLPDLDLSLLDCLADWTVVTTDRTRTPDGPEARSVLRVPESAFRDGAPRYEDLVAAVEVVVTKPGYGIIAECLAAGTAMVYTSRGSFREYDVLVRHLPRFVRSLFLAQDDLFAGRWRNVLERARALPPPPERMALDGAEVAATRLLQISFPSGG